MLNPASSRVSAPAGPIRLGVISNPNSGRNRRQLSAIRAMIALHPQIVHVVTEHSDSMPEALTAFARDGVNTVAINGGDGSVAHALAALAQGCGFEQPPLLCALPGGTTNVTVGDVGIRGSLDTAVMKLLAWSRGAARNAKVLERAVIGVRSASGESIGCGLVFGAGAVVDGIEYWHEQVRSRGMRSELSSGVAMIRTLWGMVHGHDGFAHPLRIAINAGPGHAPLEGEYKLLVITTLERLFLGIHPFWGSGEGALRLTAIERNALRFLRLLPALLRGRPGAQVTPANGYHSFPCESAGLDFHGGFTLDGEIHHVAPAQAPITVHHAGHAHFLRL